MNEKTPNPNKVKLLQMSAKAKSYQKMLELQGTMLSINKIIETMYAKEIKEKNNVQEVKFNTFKGWKKEGKQVKKGSKGYPIWSKPKPINEKNEEKSELINTDGSQARSFFRMAYIFSNLQVE